VSYLISSRQ